MSYTAGVKGAGGSWCTMSSRIRCGEERVHGRCWLTWPDLRKCSAGKPEEEYHVVFKVLLTTTFGLAVD